MSLRGSRSKSATGASASGQTSNEKVPKLLAPRVLKEADLQMYALH